MPMPSATTMGFMAMAFAVVGLTGLLGSTMAPLPLERAMARDAALDAVLQAAREPDPAAAVAALRPRLAESADAVLPLGGDLEARVARERAAMHARLLEQSATTGTVLRWLICIVTVLGAVFGIALQGMAPRRA